MGILWLSVQAYREMTKIRGKGLGGKPRLFLFQSPRDWNAGGPEGSLLFKVQQ